MRSEKCWDEETKSIQDRNISEESFMREYFCEPKRLFFSKEGITNFCDKFALSHDEVWQELIQFREDFSEEIIFLIAETAVIYARKRGMDELGLARNFLFQKLKYKNA